jgi:hypothetical protein
MKNIKTFSIVFFAIFLGCAANIPKLFIGIQPTTDPKYGYAPESPIRIGHSGWMYPKKNVEASYYFLSHLRGSNGEPLRLLYHATVDDPTNKPHSMETRGFGTIVTSGLLDEYILIVDETGDTLSLFFDIYHKGPILIPEGLTFKESEQ